MKRAAVVIGVDQTGDLPKLTDAAAGARRFEQWARDQGVTAITTLTDENGATVEIGAIKKAIRKLVDAGNIEQLIVYFAGHGVNLGNSEYWLLTDAPGDPQAAVNVRGSDTLAAYCGISHVVFISDACRTAAEGIRAQRVTGSEIFPNEEGADTEKPVDRFYACTLGRPALEVRDPATSAREFTALYTSALLDALRGKQAELLDWQDAGAERFALVRPRRLKAYLTAEVARRIARLNLQTRPVQVPDAHIVSDETAWLARLAATDVSAAARAADAADLGLLRRRGPSRRAPPVTAASVSSSLLRSALAGDARQLSTAFEDARSSTAPAAVSVADTALRASTPFGPMHHETQCGFKIRGERIVEAFATRAQTELFSVPGEVVRIRDVEPPGASVLLVLESGNGVVLPAIPEFLAALTFEDGELVDVAYEPSDNSGRWNEYQPRADEIRALRAIASASTRNGVFHLEDDDALAVARKLQYAKGLDPTLAIYAAYAYDDLQRRDLLRTMSGFLRGDLGARFFDVALLARELDGRTIGPDRELLSFVPLLAQGWALLPAHRVALPESLAGVRASLVPSAWTMFDPAGVQRVRAALQQGDVR